MDYMSGLFRIVKNCDNIWVNMDSLRKSAHFILMRLDYPLERLANLYIDRIVSLHVIMSSIVSDRDLRFTLRSYESLQMDSGTKLHLSFAYHPHTNGQTERTTQSLKDLLSACVLEQGGAWDNFLLLIEFTYNNIFHSSIEMARFKELYGRRCTTPLY